MLSLVSVSLSVYESSWKSKTKETDKFGRYLHGRKNQLLLKCSVFCDAIAVVAAVHHRCRLHHRQCDDPLSMHHRYRRHSVFHYRHLVFCVLNQPCRLIWLCVCAPACAKCMFLWWCCSWSRFVLFSLTSLELFELFMIYYRSAILFRFVRIYLTFNWAVANFINLHIISIWFCPRDTHKVFV